MDSAPDILAERRTSLVRGRLLVASGVIAASASTGATAQAEPLPNLVVTALDQGPATAAPGDALPFSATMENPGRGASPVGTVHSVAFPLNRQLVRSSDMHRGPVAPGAPATLTAHAGPDGSATPGRHEVGAVVDDVGRIRDSSERNRRARELVVHRSQQPSTVQALAPEPALSQEEFEQTHGKNVRLSWTIPAGQPHGTIYTVIEHPVNEWVTCGPPGPVTKATTSSATATFEITAGRDCFSHAVQHDVYYTVTATSPDRRRASTPPSPSCTWVSNTVTVNAGQRTWSFGCEGSALLEDAE